MSTIALMKKEHNAQGYYWTTLFLGDTNMET
jgi:hypothetical protein